MAEEKRTEPQTTAETETAGATEQQTPEPAAGPRREPVPLQTPIQRGDQTISSIQLRKPKAGELRGLSLQDVLQSDAAALIRLVPRISEPPLTEHEVAGLEADDFAEIGGTIFGFFMTPAQKAAIAKLAG